jgi:hypothetical protein
MSPCSDLSLLRRLINNELSGPEEERVSHHIDVWAVCQKTIEELLEQACP